MSIELKITFGSVAEAADFLAARGGQKAADPKTAEPKTAEPKAAESKTAEKPKTEPKTAEKPKTEPKTEPKTAEPKAAEPKAAEPKTADTGDEISYADLSARVLKLASRPNVGIPMVQHLFHRFGVKNARELLPENYSKMWTMLDAADAAADVDELQDFIANF